VKTNPYRLADDIWGIGFKTADKIALQMGFEKNSFARCRSGIVYVLNELSNEGHCYGKREQLLEEAEKILEIEKAQVGLTLDSMIENKEVILEEEDAVYLLPFYHSEVGIMQRIKAILAVDTLYSGKDVADIIEMIQKQSAISYDEVQKDAVKTAADSKFMVLTGGPGTGKTTVTLAIIKVFQILGTRVLLAAPTGRAAKRMSEATGLEAKTIHRLLEYKPAEGYKKNADYPLECDVLIIDETSMVDTILMYNLLKAVANETVVILIGDVDQLPSVGAGNVLNDIIDSGIVNVVQLTKIFRQALGSAIITNAHKINQGDFPDLKSKRNGDFFFIAEDEPAKVVKTITELCARRLPAFYKVDPINDIQVLCPMQRGETGAVNLNAVLQEALNSSHISIKYSGTVYRLGDKIMQIKNNYDKNVFNGDIGSIMTINNEDRTLVLKFDEHLVEYDATELDEVVLAYATTIHKSQGSEYQIVVAPFTLQHYVMLQRNLLYTCVTRAKKVFVLVGTKKAVSMAVRNNKTSKRNTRLAERLKFGP